MAEKPDAANDDDVVTQKQAGTWSVNEDWLAVIVGLSLLVLVLVGAIPGSIVP